MYPTAFVWSDFLWKQDTHTSFRHMFSSNWLHQHPPTRGLSIATCFAIALSECEGKKIYPNAMVQGLPWRPTGTTHSTTPTAGLSRFCCNKLHSPLFFPHIEIRVLINSLAKHWYNFFLERLSNMIYSTYENQLLVVGFAAGFWGGRCKYGCFILVNFILCTVLRMLSILRRASTTCALKSGL